MGGLSIGNLDIAVNDRERSSYRRNMLRGAAYMRTSLSQLVMRMSSQKSGRSLLVALFCSVLMAALDIAMIGPAIPAIQQYFAIDAREVAWVSAAFTLCSLGGVPVMSWLADSRSRRGVLLAAIVIFIIGAFVVVAAPTYSVLLVGRGLQGLAAAGVFPIVSSVVGDTFKDSERGRALGILGSVFGLAFIVGPALAGILIGFDWRLLFAVSIPLAVVAFALVWMFVPVQDSASRESAFDFAGLIVFVGIVSCLAFALNGLKAEGLTRSLGSARVLVPLGTMLLLVPLFVSIERRVRDPVVRLSLFESGDVRIAVLMGIGAGMCEAAMIFTPSLAIAAHGVDQSSASFMFIPLALAVALGSPGFGRLIDRVGVRTSASLASAILLGGLLVCALASSSRLGFYAGSIAIGIGLSGLLGSTLNYIMLLASEPSERTTTQGFVTLSVNTGLSFGAAVVGAVIATSTTSLSGYRNAFLVLVVVAAALLSLSLGLVREDRRP